MTEAILYVVAKYPQVQHVAPEVDPPGVHEHRGENGEKAGYRVGEETSGNEGPAHDERIAAAHLDQEKDDIKRDQGIGDHRESPAGGIIVTDWKHEALLIERNVSVRRAEDEPKLRSLTLDYQ